MKHSEMGQTPPDPLGEDRPRQKQRLSDKILTAFSHAYAVGEVEVADTLRSALESAESSVPDEGISADPLALADLWVAFIEARDAYKEIFERDAADSSGVDLAFARMKEAYLAWSHG